MRAMRSRSLLAVFIAVMMVLAACGGTSEGADDGAGDDAPLALDTTTTTAATETTEATTAVEEFDLVEAVDAYVSTIPEGFMAVGDIDAFKDAMTVEGAVLIDVREVSEYEEGHIPGAINIPIRTLAQNLEFIPTDQPVWIYCQSGWRAGMAVSALRMMGYDNVLAYPPGWGGWSAAGEEVSTEAVEAQSFGDPGLQPELVEAVDTFLSTIPEGYYVVRSVEEVKEATAAGAALVDVREPAEYEEGYIEEALSIPIRELVSTEVEIPSDTNVIVYCKSGFRASLALPVLHVLGYDNVKGFPGSFNAWVEAGEAITS